jgi:predicted nucleic acid-binding Zn ribbon protein
MPKYNYFCSACENTFEAYHGMTETLTKCVCCFRENTIERVPYCPNIVFKGKDTKDIQVPRKTGQLVKEYIEETREAIKQQKDELKKQNLENI